MVKTLENKNAKWWMSIGSSFLFFMVIIVFSYVKMDGLLNGINLKADLIKTDGSLVEVFGVAKNASYISLNGREITIDKSGAFREVISLLPGYSVIKIDSEDKFGNNAIKKFELYYKEGAKVVAMSSRINN